MTRIVFPFKQGRESEVAQTANSVIGNSKSNPNLPDTSWVTALEKSTAEYQVAMNNAADGSRTMIAIKNAKRAVVINDLVRLAYYVMQVANGDKAILLSSGFAIAQEKSASRMLLAGIEGLQVTNGKPGEITIKVKAVKGARAYVHQYSADPPSPTMAWASETSAHRQHTFAGLTPLTTYWFRVIAIGTNGQQVIADPVAKVIL